MTHVPHLVRVDQNICELGWCKTQSLGHLKTIDLRNSKAFTLYVFAIIAIDLIGHQDFTGQQKGDGACPRVDISWIRSGASKLHKVFFTLNSCEQLIPLMFLLPKKRLEEIWKMVVFLLVACFAQIVVFVVSFDFEVWGISSTQKLDDPILQFSFKRESLRGCKQ